MRKDFVLLEHAHNVGALPNPMRREVLSWLDRYLGAGEVVPAILGI